jgi:phage repressor protein C with HTH and peptisase S24 domain
MSFKRNLLHALDAAGMDQSSLAKALAITPSAVNQWIKADGLPKPARLKEIADVLGVSVSALVDDGHKPELRPAPPRLAPPISANLPRDLPVFGSAEGGPDGVFEPTWNNGDVVDYLRRPPGLQGMKDVFALYVSGDSMSPWRESGSYIYVHQTRPAAIGGYVVALLAPAREGEPARAMVKKLLARRHGEIELQQFNPPKTLTFKRESVLRLYRVIDWEEAIGAV